MAEARAESVNDWGGGVHPYRIGHRKLGMWLFIMSDSLTFGALLVAYSYARVASVNWPTPFPFSPSIVFSTAMTLTSLPPLASPTVIVSVRFLAASWLITMPPVGALLAMLMVNPAALSWFW